MFGAALAGFLLTLAPSHDVQGGKDLRLGPIVNALNCDQWEQADQNRWIAQSRADIQLDNGVTVTLARVVVHPDSGDIYFALQDICYCGIHATDCN